VWRTAALYEAERRDGTVLLKVAHKGDDCEERLQRETVALASLTDRPMGPTAFFKSFFPRLRPALPEILPPYPVASQRPYGEITFRGETRVYSVLQHAQGKFLSDLLLENPQIWHYHAAWIIITVADMLRPLAANSQCHLCLTPDVVLVDTDAQGYLRPLLLDLGLIISGSEMQSLYDWPKLCEPAYTAPELLAGRRVNATSPAADVYSLGMVFYQMLAGKPGFESILRRDGQLREAVTKYRGSLLVGRPELEQAGVVKIVERALAPNAGDRYNSVIEFADALTAIYSVAPAEKRPVPRRLYALVGCLLFALLAVLAIGAFVLAQVLLA
jgi:serine/threonine protein kinase